MYSLVHRGKDWIRMTTICTVIGIQNFHVPVLPSGAFILYCVWTTGAVNQTPITHVFFNYTITVFFDNLFCFCLIIILCHQILSCLLTLDF